MITGGRWRKVEDLFGAALDLEPEERARFLATECTGDDSLRAEVESLLNASSKADSVFEGRGQVMKPLATALRSELLLDCNLGSYHVEAHLGEGGMGIVYRATDTRNGMPVALKVLPPEVVADPGRRRRFALEARAASALDHPGIAKVYEIGRSESWDFIAMEYVDGRPLQSLLGAALPLRDTLSYGIQIASALAAAHAAGIVHRDIKPANVLVSEGGSVKVVDFGLCKLTDPESAPRDSGHSLTREGAIVGTTAYMSPEQAEGKPADCRSDIFSFGSLLYEMVTGEPAFRGDTAISTLASILRGEPKPVCDVVPRVPRGVEAVILRCLAKDPARRYQTATEVQVALEDLNRRLDAGRLRSPMLPVKYRTPVLAGSGLCLVLLASVGWFLWARPVSKPVGAPVQLTFDTGLTTDPALSPDGRWLAYASDRGGSNLSIWLQRMPKGRPVRLTTDDADHTQPVIASDGSSIAFRAEHAGGGIYSLPITGGREKLIAQGGRQPRFSPDGRWIAYWVGTEAAGDPDVIGASKVFVVPAAGGEPRQIQAGFLAARNPVWYPDSKYLLFVGCRDSSRPVAESSSWWSAPLEGGPAVETVSAATFRKYSIPSALVPAAWLSNHHVVGWFADNEQLWQIPLSPETHRVTGGAERLDLGQEFEASPSASMDGRVVFSNLSAKTSVWVLPIRAETADRPGAAVQVVSAAAGQASYPTLSADGRRICYTIWIQGTRNILWKESLDTGARDLLLTPSDWSVLQPDGAHVAYTASATGQAALFLMPWEGGPAKMLSDQVVRVWDLSPDLKSVLDFGDVQPRPVVLVDVDSHKRIDLLRHPQWNLYLAHFSPDGRWVAFDARTNPDRSRIFVAPFSGASPIPQARWIPVTDGSGMDTHAWWSPQGSRLYFVSERDGHRCLWTQALDSATKMPVGTAAPVYHSHRSSLSIGNVRRGILTLSVARDKLAFTLGEKTGNIWLK